MENIRKTYSSFFIYSYAILVSLSATLYAYTITCLNIAYRIIEKANNWKHDDFLESVAVSMSCFSGIFGCAVSGFIIVIGKRNLILIMNLLFGIGVSLELIGNYWIFVIGRLIQGFVVGIFSVIVPVYLREISPKEISGTISAMFTLLLRSGGLASFAISMLMPHPSHVSHNDQSWRVVLGFQLLIVFIQTLAFLLVFRNDTPKSSILTCKEINNEIQCRKALKEIYNEKNRVEDEFKNIIKVLEETRGKDVSFAELFGQNFRWALFIGVAVKTCQNFSGYPAVILYSSSIFSDPNDEMASVRATLYIGITNVSSVLFYSFLIDKIGRRRMLLIGVAIIVLVNLLVGICMKNERIDFARYLVILFIFANSCSLGPVPWTLIGEILPSKGVSIAVIVDWVIMTLFGLCFKIVAFKVGIENTYYFFTAFNVLTFIFSWLYIKETKGNSELENRLLYSSKNEQ